MNYKLLAAVGLVVSSMMGGCSAGEGAACVPGAQGRCIGDDDCVGVRVCEADGTWSACMCDVDAGLGGDSNSSMSTKGGTAGTSADPDQPVDVDSGTDQDASFLGGGHKQADAGPDAMMSGGEAGASGGTAGAGTGGAGGSAGTGTGTAGTTAGVGPYSGGGIKGGDVGACKVAACPLAPSSSGANTCCQTTEMCGFCWGGNCPDSPYGKCLPPSSFWFAH